jgi:hypothetical protein
MVSWVAIDGRWRSTSNRPQSYSKAPMVVACQRQRRLRPSPPRCTGLGEEKEEGAEVTGKGKWEVDAAGYIYLDSPSRWEE